MEDNLRKGSKRNFSGDLAVELRGKGWIMILVAEEKAEDIFDALTTE